MALRFQAPSFVQPTDYSFIPKTLDDIFNRYAQARMQQRQENIGTSKARIELADKYGVNTDNLDLANPETVNRVLAPLMQQRLLKMQQEKAGSDAKVANEAAQTDLYRAQAESLRAGDIYFDPVSGRQMAVPKGAKPLPKPDRPASTEFTARGFADKARQANQALMGLEASGFNPSGLGNIAQSVLPTAMQNSQFQQSDQARRQFVNAILRRESGAAIPPSELENYTRQYFPVPGDSPDTKQQKARARELAISNLEAEGERVPTALGTTSLTPPPTPTGGELRDAIRAEKARRAAARGGNGPQ